MTIPELERALAQAIGEAAPPKIRDGSPARQQWMRDLMAIHVVFLEAGYGQEFVRFFNGEPT